MIKNKVQAVIFTNAQGNKKQFLLLRMNERRGLYWQNVTGGVEENESFEQAAIREAIEETALNKSNIKKVTTSQLSFEFIDQWENQVLEKVFFIECISKWDIKLDPSEHINFAWVSESEIKRDSVHFESNYKCLHEVILS